MKAILVIIIITTIIILTAISIITIHIIITNLYMRRHIMTIIKKITYQTIQFQKMMLIITTQIYTKAQTCKYYFLYKLFFQLFFKHIENMKNVLLRMF